MIKDFRIYIEFFCLFAFCITFGGCKKEVQIPAYLEIKNIPLQITSSSQGSASAAINTAWVYVNDNPVGVYDIPAKFPITTLGNIKITITAGVKSNGISSTRIQYPSFDQYITTLNVKADTTYQLSPIVKYYPNTQFPFKEDFEDPGLLLAPTTNSDAGLYISKTSNPSEVFEGTGSGKIIMDASKTLFECANNQFLDLPTSGVPVFLEMNYNTNNDIRVGVYSSSTVGINQEEIAGFNPSKGEWKKVYIYLSPVIQKYIGGQFKIYIGVLRNSSSPEQIKTLIDNLKIVYL